MNALREVLQRLVKLVVVLLIISFMTFSLTSLLPGDPVTTILGPQSSDPVARAAVEEDLGLDKPFIEAYGDWLIGVVTEFDFGRAYSTGFEVKELIGNGLPVTIQLMLMAQFFAILISVPLAVWSAYRANTRTDKIITTTSFGLISFPNYALAVFLVYLLAVQSQVFPAVGFTRLSQDLGDNLRSVALPVMVLVAGLVAVYTRLLRSDMIATLQEDFILMARSKGLPTWHILIRHALRPSSFSLLTVFGINFGTLIGGSVILEQFFSLPGLGRLAVESIVKRDYLAVQGVVLLIATAFVLINFLVDALYSVLDPRVRRSGAA